MNCMNATFLKLSKSGYATEYEIKISKSDFMSDFKKETQPFE